MRHGKFLVCRKMMQRKLWIISVAQWSDMFNLLSLTEIQNALYRKCILYSSKWLQLMCDSVYLFCCAIDFSNLKNSLVHAVCEQEQDYSSKGICCSCLRLQHFISPRARTWEYLKLYFNFNLANFSVTKLPRAICERMGWNLNGKFYLSILSNNLITYCC